MVWEWCGKTIQAEAGSGYTHRSRSTRRALFGEAPRPRVFVPPSRHLLQPGSATAPGQQDRAAHAAQVTPLGVDSAACTERRRLHGATPLARSDAACMKRRYLHGPTLLRCNVAACTQPYPLVPPSGPRHPRPCPPATPPLHARLAVGVRASHDAPLRPVLGSQHAPRDPRALERRPHELARALDPNPTRADWVRDGRVIAPFAHRGRRWGCFTRAARPQRQPRRRALQGGVSGWPRRRCTAGEGARWGLAGCRPRC